MSPLLLLGFLVLAGAAVYAALPVYRQTQSRRHEALIEDRYLGWRGRARRPGAQEAPGRLSSGERRRVQVAGALAGLAVGCLILFFLAT